MTPKIILALYWKETKQTIWFMVGFFILIRFLIYFNWNYDPNILKHKDNFIEIVLASILTFTILLGYLLSTGIRIVESSNHLDHFLGTKPILRRDIYGIYLAIGFVNWLLWLTVTLLCLMIFDHAKIGFHYYFEDYWLLKVFFCFLFIYICTFSFGIIWPNIYLTLVVAATSIFYVISIMIQENHSIPYLLPVLILIILPPFSYYFYIQKAFWQAWLQER